MFTASHLPGNDQAGQHGQDDGGLHGGRRAAADGGQGSQVAREYRKRVQLGSVGFFARRSQSERRFHSERAGGSPGMVVVAVAAEQTSRQAAGPLSCCALTDWPSQQTSLELSLPLSSHAMHQHGWRADHHDDHMQA